MRRWRKRYGSASSPDARGSKALLLLRAVALLVAEQAGRGLLRTKSARLSALLLAVAAAAVVVVAADDEHDVTADASQPPPGLLDHDVYLAPVPSFTFVLLTNIRRE